MLSAQQARSRIATGRDPRGFTPAGPSTQFVMPFDHAATFKLKGIPGNIVQDVINISTDGVFVATEIGYSFEEDRARPAIVVIPGDDDTFTVTRLTLDQIPTTALIEGFRLNPQSERLLLEDDDSVPGGRLDLARERKLSPIPIADEHNDKVIEQIKPAEEISFLFSILDSGTGRELQDEPINNLASLGRSDGERPFRRLAQPLTFQPRSTIRLQLIERSEGIKGTVFIVLYGYKILSAGACHENTTRALPVPGIDGSRVIPFDYVSKFQLAGVPGNRIEDEVPINVEGGFMTTAIGYGLSVESTNVEVDLRDIPENQDPEAPENTTDLAKFPLRRFPVSALIEGIRLRPNFRTLAFAPNGLLHPFVPIDILPRLFERLNRPDDVSFRYSIFDTGTGRELQNQPIHNVAGLGIANGDRPFKTLVRPMQFLPRSTIRVNVTEGFGRGTLFIVFQGYKLLGAPANRPVISPGRRMRVR